MTITQLVDMARRIHDAEGVDLGKLSTRDERNARWERVVGCAYWGHPVYNLSPDKQWHCKDPDGPGGRPQGDDVVVSMPSRQAWDCIVGSGENGYRFEASDPFLLPLEQFVFVPAKPSAHSGTLPLPVVIPPPKPTPKPAYPGDAVFDAIGTALFADYAAAGQSPNPQMGRWFGRTVYDWLAGVVPTLDASIAKHRAEWRALLGLPPL